MSVVTIKSVAELQKLLSENRKVIIKFEATWCGPCHAFAPVFSRMAEESAGKIVFCKVDVDDAEEVAAIEKITCMPTIKTYFEGKPQKVVLGASERDVQAAIDALLSME